MYPFYFMLGALIPLGVLVYFVILADAGAIAKMIVVLLFVATFFIQGFLRGHSISFAPAVSEPLLWMVLRIGLAVFLLLWLKKDELNL